MNRSQLILYYNSHRKSTMKGNHPELYKWLIEQTSFLPDYEYTKGSLRYHQFNFRHCHLRRQLGTKYDPSKSESENMAAA